GAGVIKVEDANPPVSGAKLKYMVPVHECHIVQEVMLPRRPTLLQEVLDRVGNHRQTETVAYFEFLTTKEGGRARREAEACSVCDIRRQIRTTGAGITWPV